jgi:nucleoside-diphosphate-sugar epimerase
MAVYGSNDEYPVGPLSHNALLKPKSHYGVFKQANEGNAKIYWMEDRISSIGLRPHVVYGPGRDQGMTSAPTKAILAAVLHKPFHIPFGGRFCFNYAEDTARLFIQASRVLFEGSEVFNIGGKSISMQEIIHAIEIECPASKGLLTFDNIRLPFPEEVDNIEMRRVLGLYHEISLQEGIAKTVQIFKETLKTGLLKEEKFS